MTSTRLRTSSRTVDSRRLARSPAKLFVTATTVHTGQGRIFHNAEATRKVLLAPACLPTIFQAVEGEACCDGGFAGNPSVTPLVQERSSNDILSWCRSTPSAARRRPAPRANHQANE